MQEVIFWTTYLCFYTTSAWGYFFTFTSAIGMNSEVCCCFVITLLKNDTIFADSVPVDCTIEAHSFFLVILFLTFFVNIQVKYSSAPKNLKSSSNIHIKKITKAGGRGTQWMLIVSFCKWAFLWGWIWIREQSCSALQAWGGMEEDREVRIPERHWRREWELVRCKKEAESEPWRLGGWAWPQWRGTEGTTGGIKEKLKAGRAHLNSNIQPALPWNEEIHHGANV